VEESLCNEEARNSSKTTITKTLEIQNLLSMVILGPICEKTMLQKRETHRLSNNQLQALRQVFNPTARQQHSRSSFRRKIQILPIYLVHSSTT